MFWVSTVHYVETSVVKMTFFFNFKYIIINIYVKRLFSYDQMKVILCYFPPKKNVIEEISEAETLLSRQPC